MKKFNHTALFRRTALGLLTSTLCISAMAEVDVVDTSWQTPLAAEFTKLDASGNGLLKPHEVGKAFNKKSFAKADVDHDGNIDLNEYIYFKTGSWPENSQRSQSGTPTTSPNVVPNEMPAEIVPPNDDLSLYDLNDEGITAELQSLMEAHEQTLVHAQEKANGAANTDHIINAKAITTILATDELDGLQITVATFEGEVMLNGFVKRHQDKVKAEKVVMQISGVKSVINDLVVRS